MENIKLWDNDVPFYNPEFGSFVPSITPYLLNNGKINSCILVIPGGGYTCRADDHEGVQICEFLNNNGISAFILNYRVAPYSHPCMETDARRAIRLIRKNCSEFNINPEKIGVIGFSAGGHLACMSGLRFDSHDIIYDETNALSARPDTVASCYAVSSLNRACTHMGTRHNLLTCNDTDENAYALSSENIVPDNAPPFFIWHTEADEAVPVECSMRLAGALSRKNIPLELHIFPNGCHGLGLAKTEPLARSWSSLYINWLKHYGY